MTLSINPTLYVRTWLKFYQQCPQPLRDLPFPVVSRQPKTSLVFCISLPSSKKLIRIFCRKSSLRQQSAMHLALLSQQIDWMAFVGTLWWLSWYTQYHEGPGLHQCFLDLDSCCSCWNHLIFSFSSLQDTLHTTARRMTQEIRTLATRYNPVLLSDLKHLSSSLFR